MSRTWTVQVEPMTEMSVAPYGRIVAVPTSPATGTGPGWECWYGFQTLEGPWPVHMGAVLTRERPIVVDAMERHVHTYEFLYPHAVDLVQPLALPLDLDDPHARPNIATVKAFHIPVGTGLVMHPGTWHSAAFPVAGDATYSFMCMEPDGPYEPEWVGFAGGDIVAATRQ